MKTEDQMEGRVCPEDARNVDSLWDCVYAGDNNQGEGEQDSAHLFQRTIHVLKAKAAFVNIWLRSSFTVHSRFVI